MGHPKTVAKRLEANVFACHFIKCFPSLNYGAQTHFFMTMPLYPKAKDMLCQHWCGRTWAELEQPEPWCQPNWTPLKTPSRLTSMSDFTNDWMGKPPQSRSKIWDRLSSRMEAVEAAKGGGGDRGFRIGPYVKWWSGVHILSAILLGQESRAHLLVCFRLLTWLTSMALRLHQCNNAIWLENAYNLQLCVVFQPLTFSRSHIFKCQAY